MNDDEVFEELKNAASEKRGPISRHVHTLKNGTKRDRRGLHRPGLHRQPTAPLLHRPRRDRKAPARGPSGAHGHPGPAHRNVQPARLSSSKGMKEIVRARRFNHPADPADDRPGPLQGRERQPRPLGRATRCCAYSPSAAGRTCAKPTSSPGWGARNSRPCWWRRTRGTGHGSAAERIRLTAADQARRPRKRGT